MGLFFLRSTKVVSAAPAWFAALDDFEVGTITSELADVDPDPGETAPYTGTGFKAVVDAYTGSHADHDRLEIQVIARGGHGDRGGNDVFVLHAGNDTPVWEMVRASTTSVGDNGGDVIDGTGLYSDGSPRPDHGYNTTIYADGRSWFFGAAMAYTGYHSTCCHYFDRSDNTYTTIGRLWTPATDPNSSFDWQGSSAYDPVENRIWVYGTYADVSGVFYVDCDTNTLVEALDGSNAPIPLVDGNNMGLGQWSIIDPVKRVMITGGGANMGNTIRVMDIDNPGPPISKTPTGTAPGSIQASGAVFHAASGKVLIWNKGRGNTIGTLTIPADPINGTYSWGSFSVTGTTLTATHENNTYSKFTMLADMGDGRACLFVISDWDGPTYAVPLPANGAGV